MNAQWQQQEFAFAPFTAARARGIVAGRAKAGLLSKHVRESFRLQAHAAIYHFRIRRKDIREVEETGE